MRKIYERNTFKEREGNKEEEDAHKLRETQGKSYFYERSYSHSPKFISSEDNAMILCSGEEEEAESAFAKRGSEVSMRLHEKMLKCLLLSQGSWFARFFEPTIYFFRN